MSAGEFGWLPQALAVLLALTGLGLALLWRRTRILTATLNVGEDGVAVIRDTRVLSINPAARRLLQRSGRTVDGLLANLAPDTAVAVDRLIRGAVAGTGAVVELSPDDTQRMWRIAADPLPGWPGCARLTLTDITRQRQMQGALRSEQHRLVDFMDRAPIGFYSVGRDGRFVFANATLGTWVGIPPRQLVHDGWRLHDLLLNPPPPGTPPHLTVPAADPETPARAAFRGAEGEAVPVALTQTVVMGPDGRIDRTRTVVQDIRPERAMQRALEASETRFRRVFVDAPLAVGLLDRDHRLLEVNPAMAKLIAGSDPESLIGRPLADLLDLDDRPPAAAALEAVARDGGVQAVEIRFDGPEGRVGEMHVSSLTPMPGPDDPALMVQVIDLTARRSLERQFSQSQKMQAIGQLAGGIAHDFNNLLTAMIGYCDLLLQRHRAGDPSFADIMQITQNANRAAGLTRQLLAFSRQQTLTPRVIDVGEVLSDVSHLIRRLVGERIEVTIVHGRNLGRVKVDQGQFEQVLVNLAVNARDAMPDGGTLSLRSRDVHLDQPRTLRGESLPAGRYVVVEAGDTGSGIATDNLDRIFEPFFSTKAPGAGTGLGLATVYGILRQFSGDIEVESIVGEGTVFRLYLPVAETETGPVQQAAPATPAPARDLTGQGRILLAEDEDPVRALAARALANKGYEVVEARDGEEAVALFASATVPFDLLVTDLVMPGIDGAGVIERVRADRPDLPIICVSGYAEDTDRQKLGADDGVAFLPKPFTLKQLAEAVKAAFERPTGVG